MTKKNITAVLAFETNERFNRLTELALFELVDTLTNLAGGVSVVEQFGGYRMDNGQNAVEYSYKFELFGLDKKTQKAVKSAFMQLKELHHQESIIINNKFIY